MVDMSKGLKSDIVKVIGSWENLLVCFEMKTPERSVTGH